MFIPGVVLCAQLVCSVIAPPPGEGFQELRQCESVVPRMMAKAAKAPYMVGGCIYAADTWKPSQDALTNRFKSVFAPPGQRNEEDG